MTVIYTLTTNFIGLVGQSSDNASGNFLYQDKQVVKIRAVDPLPKLKIKQDAKGYLKGVFNKAAGTCVIAGEMVSENVMINHGYYFKLLIDQSQSLKETAMIRIVLNRTLKCMGNTTVG